MQVSFGDPHRQPRRDRLRVVRTARALGLIAQCGGIPAVPAPDACVRHAD